MSTEEHVGHSSAQVVQGLITRSQNVDDVEAWSGQEPGNPLRGVSFLSIRGEGQAESERLREETVRLRREIETLRTENTELQARLEQMERHKKEEYDRLHGQITELNEQLVAFQKTKYEDNQTIRQLRTDVQELKDTVTELKKDKAALHTQNVELHKRIDDLEQKRLEEKLERQALEEKSFELEQKFTDTTASLRRDIKKKDSAITRLDSDVAQLKKDLQAVRRSGPATLQFAPPKAVEDKQHLLPIGQAAFTMERLMYCCVLPGRFSDGCYQDMNTLERDIDNPDMFDDDEAKQTEARELLEKLLQDIGWSKNLKSLMKELKRSRKEVAHPTVPDFETYTRMALDHYRDGPRYREVVSLYKKLQKLKQYALKSAAGKTLPREFRQITEL